MDYLELLPPREPTKDLFLAFLKGIYNQEPYNHHKPNV